MERVTKYVLAISFLIAIFIILVGGHQQPQQQQQQEIILENGTKIMTITATETQQPPVHEFNLSTHTSDNIYINTNISAQQAKDDKHIKSNSWCISGDLQAVSVMGKTKSFKVVGVMVKNGTELCKSEYNSSNEISVRFVSQDESYVEMQSYSGIERQ